VAVPSENPRFPGVSLFPGSRAEAYGEVVSGSAACPDHLRHELLREAEGVRDVLLEPAAVTRSHDRVVAFLAEALLGAL
jgi:hypothetical protein